MLADPEFDREGFFIVVMHGGVEVGGISGEGVCVSALGYLEDASKQRSI
jgi:hypothetical protein